MPAVLKEMTEAINSIEDCEKLLEELKKQRTVQLMTQLKDALNQAEKMVEHKESLSGKLEPELIQWDPQSKLERRDHELDTVEDMLDQFESKLNKEQAYFETEMAELEKKESDAKMDPKFKVKLEQQKTGLMDLVQDAEDLIN
jgi:hypothetical protein